MNYNIFKDVGVKIYKQIQAEHGENYIPAYHQKLAEINGLVDTFLYNKLRPMQKVRDKNYLIAIIDNSYNCVHVAYTESPFSYWINILKNNKYGNVKDILIMDEDLDNKSALRKAKELNTNRLPLSRKLKIDYIFG